MKINNIYYNEDGYKLEELLEQYIEVTYQIDND